MAFTFNMHDDESRKGINNFRENIFHNKFCTADILEKKVIATAKISFKVVSAGRIVMDFPPYNSRRRSQRREDESSIYCDSMYFHIDEELFYEVRNSGKKKDIEKSIWVEFIELLGGSNIARQYIKSLQICELDIEAENLIEPNKAWLDKQRGAMETKPYKPTEEVTKEEEQVKAPSPNSKPRVFIVYGHDHDVRDKLKLMLHDMNAIPILVDDATGGSKNLIDLLDKEISNIDFVIVLMIPDDIGSSNKDGATQKPRVRQNVIFEYGIAVGKMNRERIIVIRNKDELEMPSDIVGVRYYEYEHNIKEVEMRLQKEFRALGFTV